MVQSSSYEFSSISAKGRVRPSNEDCVATVRLTEEGNKFSRDVVILALADGVGGEAAGEIASRVAVDSFCAAFVKSLLMSAESTPVDFMKSSFKAANRAVHTASRDNPSYAGMSTTLTATFLSASKVVVGHVGDSRCYLFHNHNLSLLTTDHSKGGTLVQVIGSSQRMTVSIRELDLEIGDSLMICSDGLTNLVEEKSIAETLNKDAKPKKLCERLILKADNQGGSDNISVMIAQRRK